MQALKTPGVYVQEIATLPPSVAEVATAIPVFIGYTETGAGKTVRINSMLDYQATFGGPKSTAMHVIAKLSTPPVIMAEPRPENVNHPEALLWYCLSHYFLNGGGPCWIKSVGDYTAPLNKDDFTAAFAQLESEDEPTLIVFPDATRLAAADYATVVQAALAHCNKMQDRFTLVDVPNGDVETFRDGIGINHLSYGAAYHPYLRTTMSYVYDEGAVDVAVETDTATFRRRFGGAGGLIVTYTGAAAAAPQVTSVAGAVGDAVDFAIDALVLTISNVAGKTASDVATAWTGWRAENDARGFELATDAGGGAEISPFAGEALQRVTAEAMPLSEMSTGANPQTALYNLVKERLGKVRVALPPSATVAGIIASVDRDRGVWKAPANVSVSGVSGPVEKITDEVQEDLNVDATAGKSINAIRAFSGKGTLVWGARTLAGNDNEWRYVSVRRLFLTIEESTKKASAFAVFEPNDATTWLKVKGMIESYLFGLWERGALAGSKSEDAYFVNVGLGRTMTAQDVLEGRLIVEIGIAAVRPAEFIVLRFMHKLQES